MQTHDPDPLRRRFNGTERAALYIAQDGHCALCGTELEPSWHADHIKAWSHQGPTDVVNGQALCPTCNLKKGNKHMELREWQKQAKRQYIAESKQDWLLHVTPGGGKTTWALSVASDLLQDNVVDRIVVVVPTDSLRTQWTQQNIVNLAIVTNGDGGRENKSFQGCVITYAQVASQPDLYRMACRSRTLVIFDEVHHAGDSQTWGQGIETAFNPAIRRIAMTGTPWRSPKRGKIPFVKYDAKGEVTPDFSFNYSQAVRSGVCRPVQFYPFDGSVTYVNVNAGSCCTPQTEIVQLGEAEDDDSSILRDILRADGKWMSSILEKASHTLEDIRNEVADAKGLIVVHDRSEARAVAKVIESMTHERPALIISDPEENEPIPQEELKRFSKNQQKWAVAVDMVSEGVDIPPLYVCVYATRKKTSLRFRQIVGRVIRKRPSDELPAVVFIPAMAKFLELAGDMEKELLHVVDEEIRESDKKRKEAEDRENEDDPSLLENLVLTTSEAVRVGAITGGHSYLENELQVAESKCSENGIPVIYAPNIAKILRSQGAKPDTSKRPPSQEEPSLQEKWKLLRGLLNTQINKVAGLITKKETIEFNVAIQKVNSTVKKWFHKERHEMTIEELGLALTRVNTWRETMLKEIADES